MGAVNSSERKQYLSLIDKSAETFVFKVIERVKIAYPFLVKWPKAKDFLFGGSSLIFILHSNWSIVPHK